VGVSALLTIVEFGAPERSKVLEVIDTLLDVDACARSRTAGELLANCFDKDQLIEAFGTVLGAILAPILLASAVVDYFHGALNALWDQIGDRSDTELTLARGADTSRFVGQWHVHGWQLEIRADRTVSMTWNAGGCGPVTCTGHGVLSWKWTPISRRQIRSGAARAWIPRSRTSVAPNLGQREGSREWLSRTRLSETGR
jgi:hypothetical protein